MKQANCLLIVGAYYILQLSSFNAGLRVDSSSNAKFGGWKIVTNNREHEDANNFNEDELRRELIINTAKPQTNTTSGKTVEWDDDDPQNDLEDRWPLKGSAIKPTIDVITEVDSDSLLPINRRKTTGGQFAKLVYHGRVKNSSLKIVDGITFHVDTHKPVAISRKSSPSKQRKSRFEEMVSIVSKPSSSDEAQEEPTALKPRLAEELKIEAKKKTQVESRSVDQWKPIAFADSTSRARRKMQRSKQSTEERLASSESPTKATASNTTTIATNADFQKWKPIQTKIEDSKQIKKRPSNLKVSFTSSLSNKRDVDRKLGGESGSFRRVGTSIEEPFDDEGIIVAKLPDLVRESSAKSPEILTKWTPVETTTPSTATTMETIATETTTLISKAIEAPMSVKSNQSANGSESDQRSASDLNYIYSSQPMVSSASNGYYSNYLIQNQQQQQPQPPMLPPLSDTIIDTTSGQTPEMIADRVPEVSAPISSGDYSLPQTSASFQPAQPPPSRPSYGGYGDANHYGSHSGQQQQQQPSAQPTRQVQQPTSAPVVRQEHHYHYYNSQQQPPERQFPPNSNGVAQTNVIRELQPLFISQPMVQQQPVSTSTTPAPSPPPQIIREIIKEVPVQQMQFQAPRIVLPAPQQIPVPIPVPVTFQRDVESTPAVGYSYGISAPASRIIRQLSNSVPSVAVRLPSLPQIRLPLPSIQMPIRLAAPGNPAPVTRQTGSFVIPPVPKKTTTFLTETQAMPTHTTIMHTTQFTPATRTTVYTTEHQAPQTMAAQAGYKR